MHSNLHHHKSVLILRRTSSSRPLYILMVWHLLKDHQHHRATNQKQADQSQILKKSKLTKGVFNNFCSSCFFWRICCCLQKSFPLLFFLILDSLASVPFSVIFHLFGFVSHAWRLETTGLSSPILTFSIEDFLLL